MDKAKGRVGECVLGEERASVTVLTVDTYAAISDVLPHFWPYYQKAGCDVVGIERTNKATTWPNSAPHYAIGIDYFKSWSAYQGDPLLCKRWLGIIDLFLSNPDFAKYDDLCAIEWDCLFFKPLPPFDKETGLVLNKAGGAMRGFKAPCFFHLPWWMDRKRAAMISDKGHALIKRGDIEHGAPDFFMGLIVAELGLKWTPIHFYTKNRICSYEFDEAKKHLANGAFGVHGIRDKAGLDRLLT